MRERIPAVRTIIAHHRRKWRASPGEISDTLLDRNAFRLEEFPTHERASDDDPRDDRHHERAPPVERTGGPRVADLAGRNRDDDVRARQVDEPATGLGYLRP